MTDTPNEFAALRVELERLEKDATPGPLHQDGTHLWVEAGGFDREPWQEEVAGAGETDGALFKEYRNNHATILRALRMATMAVEYEAVTRSLATVLPMAKGWAAEHPVGENQQMVDDAADALASLATAREASQ